MTTVREHACSVDNCCGPQYAKGLCQRHYRRLRRHGDPTLGNRRKHEALEYMRDVVMRYSGDDCLLWPFYLTKKGRAYVALNGKNTNVARVVCEHANGPAPSPTHHAAHSCGRGHEGCVTPRHLSWKTPAENAADMVVHGTRLQGEQCHSAKLTEANVIAIRQSEFGCRHLARQFNVHVSTIKAVRSGRQWAHVEQLDGLDLSKAEKARMRETY